MYYIHRLFSNRLHYPDEAMAMDEKASTTDPVDIDDDFVVELVKKPLRLYVINGPHKGLEFKAQIPGNDRKKYQFGIGRGKIFTTGNGKHIINGLCLSKDSEISNKHAEVSFLETGQVFFLDRGSKHGSYLNSTKLSANVSTPVHNRDEIRIGNTTIRVDTVLEAPKAEDFCFICNKSLASLTRVLVSRKLVVFRPSDDKNRRKKCILMHV